MPRQQATPKLDVLQRIEIAEIVQAHRKAVRMVNVEKRNFALQSPFKIRPRLGLDPRGSSCCRSRIASADRFAGRSRVLLSVSVQTGKPFHFAFENFVADLA